MEKKIEETVENNVVEAGGTGESEPKKTVKKTTKKKEEKIGDALMKVALGYQIAEVTEEYAEVNGELKLTKRKKTKKDVPPDLKAVQLLLTSGESADYGGWTDEALQAEKAKLLAELKEQAAIVAGQVEEGKEQAQTSAKRSVAKKSGAKKKGAAKKTAAKKTAVAKKSAVKKSAK